jgi:hypothetical protein
MKQILEEINEESNGKVNVKRYYYDSKTTDSIVIEQIERFGKEEKKVSEMRIPLKNAPDKIKDLINE